MTGIVYCLVAFIWKNQLYHIHFLTQNSHHARSAVSDRWKWNRAPGMTCVMRHQHSRLGNTRGPRLDSSLRNPACGHYNLKPNSPSRVFTSLNSTLARPHRTAVLMARTQIFLRVITCVYVTLQETLFGISVSGLWDENIFSSIRCVLMSHWYVRRTFPVFWS